MKRRNFLALSAFATAGELAGAALAAEQKPDAAANGNPFSWTAYGLTFSFDFYKRQLRQRFILPKDSPSAVQAQLTPSAERTASLADTSASAFDSLSLEVALHCSGEDSADHHGMKFTAGMPGLRLELASQKQTVIPGGKRLVLTHHDPILNLRVESFYDAFEKVPIVRRYTSVTNLGSKPVGIEYVSSAMLANFASPSEFEKQLRIHLCYNSWQAEGQWHACRPSELGFVPNGEFSVSGAFFDSLGTWSSERYLPMAVIENTALNLAWFWQIEYNGSWHAEISQTSSKTLYAYVGGPDEQHAHAWKNLQPGETYQSVPVAIGCVHGGFPGAVKQLTRYRRNVCARPYQDRNRSCPVIYNDAVTLNLEPSTDKELPLIGAAAAVGCEYYVIDAGWYTEINQNWWGAVGDWQPSKTRWPEGLPSLPAHIRKCGMTPGLWLEPEVAGINSPLARKPDDWFFMRHGRRVIDHGRYLLDFRNPNVRAYLNSVVHRIISEYGVEYIKLDYNVDALEGTELHAESFGQGLHEHNLALLAWLESVLHRYPNLIIENCASGGGRIDYAMLSRLQLESASDQDDYRRYPSLVTGLSAGLLPEQLGVWSFPSATGTADEASFHMVNAMLCRIHQSGDIAKCNPAVLAQIKTGIRTYKNVLRQHIPDSIPFYPLGMPLMTDTVSPVALGMRSPGAVFLAVWRLNGEEKVEIPWAGQSLRLLYPTDLDIRSRSQSGKIEITFPRINMACILTSFTDEAANAKT